MSSESRIAAILEAGTHAHFALPRFVLVVLVAVLPLQPLYAQSCCPADTPSQSTHEREAAGHRHGDAAETTDTPHAAAADCCPCCDSHGTCSSQTCPSADCFNAQQVLPAVMLDAHAQSDARPATGARALHTDIPQRVDTKPPKRTFG